jgi:hypothetical protein
MQYRPRQPQTAVAAAAAAEFTANPQQYRHRKFLEDRLEAVSHYPAVSFFFPSLNPDSMSLASVVRAVGRQRS